MSGFIAGFGEPRDEDVAAMLDKISHRGPKHSGRFTASRIALSQNYLDADQPLASPGAEIPVSPAPGSPRRVCYDGQLGHPGELARLSDVKPGPFLEERLLLSMHNLHGPEMMRFLDDGIFAFVLWDGEHLLAARDPLGIKTLFYGRKEDTLYFASELKALAEVTDDVHEFPPGHLMDETGKAAPFAAVTPPPREEYHDDPDRMLRDVRDIIERSLTSRVDFARPTAALLSGGMDSSIISALAAELLRSRRGPNARLRTYAMGVGESQDIRNARLVAEHIGSDHRELLVDLPALLDALPEVIYALESFDPSLVRSAVSNHLISRYAREDGYEVLLSGEGGDELFCGYTYLKELPADKIPGEQVRCLGFLHNNASLRLDRMNQWNSVRVVAPFVSGELLQYALRIPPEYKIRPHEGELMEKWILRKAFASVLPEAVVWRPKQEFSQGSGSAGVLPGHFEGVYSDEDLAEAREKQPLIRSKEELHYYRLFTERFGEGSAVETVGQWVCL